jgi:hypothetical protein
VGSLQWRCWRGPASTPPPASPWRGNTRITDHRTSMAVMRRKPFHSDRGQLCERRRPESWDSEKKGKRNATRCDQRPTVAADPGPAAATRLNGCAGVCRYPSRHWHPHDPRSGLARSARGLHHAHSWISYCRSGHAPPTGRSATAARRQPPAAGAQRAHGPRPRQRRYGSCFKDCFCPWRRIFTEARTTGTAAPRAGAYTGKEGRGAATKSTAPPCGAPSWSSSRPSP